MPKLTMYFVRHGKTDTNEKGLLVGQSGNPVLIQEGKDSALALGKAMREKGIQIDAVYSSPLGRALETAKCLLAGLGQECEIIPVEDIKDVNWGDAEGLTNQQMAEKLGVTNPFSVFGDIDDADFVSPIHSESMHDFYQRFSRGVEGIVREESKAAAEAKDGARSNAGEEYTKNDGRSVLVVAHSSMGTYFGKKFLNENGTRIDNTTLTRVSYDFDKKEYKLMGLNETL